MGIVEKDIRSLNIFSVSGDPFILELSKIGHKSEGCVELSVLSGGYEVKIVNSLLSGISFTQSQKTST